MTLPLKLRTRTCPVTPFTRIRSLAVEPMRTEVFRGTFTLQCTIALHAFGCVGWPMVTRRTRVLWSPPARRVVSLAASSSATPSFPVRRLVIVASTSVTSAPVMSTLPAGLSSANVPPVAMANFCTRTTDLWTGFCANAAPPAESTRTAMKARILISSA
jgi:hypothetical protein